MALVMVMISRISAVEKNAMIGKVRKPLLSRWCSALTRILDWESLQ
jgi:hypothetical protein